MEWLTNNILNPIYLIFGAIGSFLLIYEGIQKNKKNVKLESLSKSNLNMKIKINSQKTLLVILTTVIALTISISLIVANINREQKLLIRNIVASPNHIQLEFSTKNFNDPVDPDGSIAFRISGASRNPDTVLEVYAHDCSNPADFPKLGNTYYYKSFPFNSTHPFWTNGDYFTDTGFAPQRFYTILVIQKNGDTITGYSDLCTFYMSDKYPSDYSDVSRAAKDRGIYGKQYKYIPNWPDLSGPIIISGPHLDETYRPNTEQLNNWLSDSAPNGVQWYNNLPQTEKEKYEESSAKGFYARNPYYLQHIHKQGRFFIVDNDTTPNDTYPQLTGRDKIYLSMTNNSSRYDIIEGIVRIVPNIKELLP